MQKGKADEAITCFQNALSSRPDDADGHSDLGVALIQKGRVDEAIWHFQKALESEPNYTNSLVNLGTALLQKGRVDEAIGHFQKALGLDADSADARYGLGSAYSHEGKMAEAITQYQKALQIKPVNPEVQNNLAWILATCADRSLRNGYKAMELARQADELAGGGNPIILHTLAAALAEVGRLDEAINRVKEAIGLAQAAGQKDFVIQLNEELEALQVKTSLPSMTNRHR